jgi:hypothetical protein
MSMSAAFENLRADGAFLVSAENKGAKVTSLKIKSLKGRSCKVECKNIKSVVNTADNKAIPFERNGNIVSFETEADAEYILI